MIVALVSDLIFQSKIAAVAAHLGIQVQFDRTKAAAQIAAPDVTGLLVDLTIDQAATIEPIRAIRQADPAKPIIAFFPHVQADLARQARAAGASRVLTRSQFTETLPDILRALATQNPASHWSDTADRL